MNAIITPDRAALMENVIKGDLSKLSPAERNQFYLATCDSLGLNPMTTPFAYITLNGRLTLYAKRDAADQLRKIHGVSIEIKSQTIDNGLIVIAVQAKDKTGRTDEDMGAVPLPQGAGEIRANAMLKAVTKAKRRVTLSICGLGFLDETEVEDIPGAKSLPQPQPHAAHGASAVDHGSPAGEEGPAGEPIGPDDEPDDRLAQIENALYAAAERGSDTLRKEWETLAPADKKHFEAMKNRLLKPRAIEKDAELARSH